MKDWDPWLIGFIFLVGFILILSIYGITKVIFYRYSPPPHLEISKDRDEEISTIEIEKVEKDIPQYRIAIVIDDMGYNMDKARDLLELSIPISFAVLPFLPHSTDVAREANIKGKDVLLHIPMEPKDYPEEDPGEGSLFVSMSDEDILDQLTKDIEAIPHIVGVNNHMGSKFSEDQRKMEIVLKAVKERELFFLDSRTTAESTGYTLAKELGLKTLDRQVFLDNDRDIEHTLNQFEELIRTAKERGSAVAIGHPHPTTISALKEIIDRFEEEDIEVVPVSSLLD